MTPPAYVGVHVEPDLVAEVEAVLHGGETLSEFVLTALQRAIQYRRVQIEFHAHGEAALEHYQQTGISY